MFVYLLTAVSILVLIFSSCIRDEMEYERRLVVEGWIDSDGHPVVILTTTINPDAVKEGNVDDIVVKWGKVVINDGENDIVLSGTPDRDYFPPYIYTDYSFVGTPGKTYAIKASFQGMEAYALTTMMPSPSIDSVSFASASDKGRKNVFVHFKPDVKDDAKTYYKIFVMQKGRDKRYLPGFMGDLAVENTTKSVSMPVCRGKSDIDTLDYYSSFERGDTLFLKLARMERQAYEFWTDYENAITIGGSSVISSTYSMRTNMEEGLGYWFAYGVDKAVVIVP